jgi:hypothetical protein
MVDLQGNIIDLQHDLTLQKLSSERKSRIIGNKERKNSLVLMEM